MSKAAAPTTTATRSITEWLSWVLLLVFLVVTVPPMLCMPLWCDVTYYDYVAQNIHQGKLLYVDVWEINFPGMGLIQSALRRLIGFRVEALRIVDLIVVAFILAASVRLLRLGQSNRLPRIPIGLFSLLGCIFYTSTAEGNHCQRDVWMLLPIMVALNVRHESRLNEGSNRTQLIRSAMEGILWGIAVWIKPHVVVIGFAVWFQSVVLQPNRRRLVDTVGLLIGGMSLGAGGLGALWFTGAWSSFWDIMLNWNPDYVSATNSVEERIRFYTIHFGTFFPWSVMVVLSVLGSTRILMRQFVNRLKKSEDDLQQDHSPAPLLCACLLGWLAEYVVLQRPHDYVLVGMTLLGLTTLLAVSDATNRVRRWQVVAWTIVVCSLIHHPALHPRRLDAWKECLAQGSTPEMRQRLSMNTGIGKTDWPDLKRIQAFLEKRGVRDGEVTCYSVSTHPLYLEMGINAPTRYPYLDLLINYHPSQVNNISQTVYESSHRYLVADVWSAGVEFHPREFEKVESSSTYPRGFPGEKLKEFPWNQPLLFRAGRYTVHWVLPRNRCQQSKQ